MIELAEYVVPGAPASGGLGGNVYKIESPRRPAKTIWVRLSKMIDFMKEDYNQDI